MKISFDLLKASFTGRREDRNHVRQLKTKNDYSLTENNQRNIKTSIDNLAKDSSDSNIKFLLNVGENLKYASKFKDINKKSNNDWEERLKNATTSALKGNKSEKKESFEAEFKRVFLDEKKMSKDEKDIFVLRNKILENKTLGKAISDSNLKNVKSIPENLDNFVVSSEIQTEEKKAVLEKLNYFISPQYKIDNQLKNKKPQVLGEILNDIIVKTPDEERLKMKQVNQKLHGMCVAISLARKLVAYEDKAKYVDNIMNEISDSDKMEIYDISKIGSKEDGAKIKVNKIPIDYDYAEELGYRIIDASTLQWMNIAGTVGNGTRAANTFTAFDKENFDTFHDSFKWRELDDESLRPKHQYLRTLEKAKDSIEGVLKSNYRVEAKSLEKRNSIEGYKKDMARVNGAMLKIFEEITPKDSAETPIENMNKFVVATKNKDSKIYVDSKNDFVMKSRATQSAIKSINKKYPSEKLESTAEKLVGLLELRNSIDSKISEKYVGGSDKAKSRHYRALYSAAGSYRTAVKSGLDDPKILGDQIVMNKIPNRESRISTNLKNLIVAIKDPKNIDLAKGLAKNFGVKNKKELEQALITTVATVDKMKTTDYDELMFKMTFGSRKDFLKGVITDAKANIESGDKEELALSAQQLNVKPEKKAVLGSLDKLDKELEQGVSNERYDEIFSTLGFDNQSDILLQHFTSLQESFRNSKDDPSFIPYFFAVNGIDEKSKNLSKDLTGAIHSIATKINENTMYIQDVENKLEVKDAKGNSLNTINPKNIIMNKLEKAGAIVSEPMLRSIQDKFAKIDSDRVVIENAEVKGEKIKKVDLYHFDENQVAVFDKIEKKIPAMYREVKRATADVQTELDKPLADLARSIGREKGSFWVHGEGSSGMSTPDAIRVIEQMTGHPYYKEDSLAKTVEKIKEGPRSGVSMTSVYHNSYGGHGMYIADITPVEVKDPKTGEITIKDAMMHDNTWGYAEDKFNWVDSMGLNRSDYGSGRGGVTGYIIDKAWRNGTLIDDFETKPGRVEVNNVEHSKYKKLAKDADDSQFRLFWDAVLPGKNDGSETAAASLVEDIFLTPIQLMGSFSDVYRSAADMDKTQLNKTIFKVETAGEYANVIIDKMYEMINGDNNSESVNKGITSREDYEKIPSTSPLKFYMKKLAIVNSYPRSIISDPVSYATTYDDLNRIDSQVVDIAKNDFRYVFGKDKGILRYAKHETKHDLEDVLTKYEQKYDFKIKNKDEEIKNVFKDEKSYDMNAPLSKIIETASSKINQIIERNIDDETYLPIIQKDLDSDLNKILRNKLEFQIDDLNSQSNNLKIVKKWIDKTYNPASDADFVKIFRNIQEMDKENFENLVVNNLSKSDLGIQEKDEYEFIKEIRNLRPVTNRQLKNIIRNQEFTKDLNKEVLIPIYKNYKFNNVHIYSTYENGKSMESSLRDLQISFSNLDTESFVKSQRDSALKQYGARPAFPQVQIETDENIELAVDDQLKFMEDKVLNIGAFGNLIKIYDMNDEMKTFMSEHSGALSSEDVNELKQLSAKMLVSTKADDSLPVANKALNEIIANDSIAEMKDVSKQMKAITSTIGAFQAATPKTTIQDLITRERAILKEQKSFFLNATIRPRYRDDVSKVMNNWIGSLAKGQDEKADNLSEEIVQMSKDFSLLKKPNELLLESLKYAPVLKQEVLDTVKTFENQTGKSLNEKQRAQVENSIISKNPLAVSYENALYNAFTKSALSSIEYSLMDAARKGYVDGIKSRLDNLKIPKGIKDAGIKLGTDEGVSKMIDTVKSYSGDNFDTLWLLLNQTGLNDKAMELEMKNVNLDAAMQDATNITEEFKATLITSSIAKALVSPIMKHLSAGAIAPEAVVPTLSKSLETNLLKNKIKDKTLLKSIVDKLNETYVPTLQKNARVAPAEIFRSLATNVISTATSEQISLLNSDSKALSEEIDSSLKFVSGLDLADDTEISKQRLEYVNKINALLEFQNKCTDELAQLQDKLGM